MTDSATEREPAAPRATTSVVHAAAQFARAVRYRKGIVIGALAATLLLGGLYYGTATRYYQSRASLMVLQVGSEVTRTDTSGEDARKGLMPTYQRLLTSAAVLSAATRRLDREDRFDFEGVPERLWVECLRRNLSASVVRQTNIIELSYRSKKPRAAAAVVNAVVASYLEFLDRTHKTTAREINDIFTREKAQLEEKLEQRQLALSEAKTRYKDLDLHGTNDRPPQVARVLQLNEALIKAQQERLELQATLTSIQEAIRRGDDLQQFVLSLEGVVGRTYLMSYLGIGEGDAGARAALERALLEHRAELTTARQYFGPTHPRVNEIAERIRLTEAYLADYDRKVRAKLSDLNDQQLGPLLVNMVRQNLASVRQREQALSASFEEARDEAVQMNDAMTHLEMLRNEVAWLHKLRETLRDRIESINLSEQHGTIRTALIDEPTVPVRPASPRLAYVLLVSLAGGLGLGLGAVYVLEALDDRFRTPDELRVALGAPVLAMIRRLPPCEGEGIEAVHTFARGDSAEAEAFRTLRTSLSFSAHGARRMAVSSTEPGDGKTTVLANLAVACAHAGKRILLVDADMRRPGLTTLLGLKGRPGLSDVLQGSEPGQAAPERIVATALAGLDVLPAGPRRANPAELLSGPALSELLAWAETRYDQVLIDAPPALVAADATIIGRLVDGVLLVVRPDKNRRQTVCRAAGCFASVDIELLGLVINRVADEEAGEYYGYGYGEPYGDTDTQQDGPPVVPRRAA